MAPVKPVPMRNVYYTLVGLSSVEDEIWIMENYISKRVRILESVGHAKDGLGGKGGRQARWGVWQVSLWHTSQCLPPPLILIALTIISSLSLFTVPRKQSSASQAAKLLCPCCPRGFTDTEEPTRFLYYIQGGQESWHSQGQPSSSGWWMASGQRL